MHLFVHKCFTLFSTYAKGLQSFSNSLLQHIFHFQCTVNNEPIDSYQQLRLLNNIYTNHVICTNEFSVVRPVYAILTARPATTDFDVVEFYECITGDMMLFCCIVYALHNLRYIHMQTKWPLTDGPSSSVKKI